MKTSLPWVLAALVAGWVAWLWLWPLGLSLAVPLAAWAGRWGRKPALITALGSPFVLVPIIGFVTGVVHWQGGKADLRYPGLMGIESGNLHPQYRVPVVSTGLPDDGRSAFFRVGRNAAIHTLGRVFGPMPMSYRGQLPTREVAWSLLDAAHPAALVGSQVLLLSSYQSVPVGAVAEELTGYPDKALRANLAGETLVVGVPNQLWLVDIGRAVVITRWRRPGVLVRWPDQGAPGFETVGDVAGSKP